MRPAVFLEDWGPVHIDHGTKVSSQVADLTKLHRQNTLTLIFASYHTFIMSNLVVVANITLKDYQHSFY